MNILAGPPGIEPGTYGLFAGDEKDLAEFRDFLLVDDQKAETTARDYTALVRRFLSKVDKPITVNSIRACLKQLKEVYSRDHYALTLSALKAYFGRYKRMPQLISTFKFPPKIVKPKIIPDKRDLRRFYNALPSVKMRAYFMLVASSGLRRGEVLGLEKSDVDFKLRMMTPKNHKGSTKYSWVSFYNEETEKILTDFRSKLNQRESRSQKIIPISSRDFKQEWKIAKRRTGLEITSKVLRDWFAEEMGKLGVADRYVDAFQGRTPKSVLARHYTDYNPTKLKKIYYKADLTILE